MKIRVLTFHNICSKKNELRKFRSITTSYYKFIFIILVLRLIRYKFYLFNEIPDKQKGKAIVLNFDDGYHSVYTRAFPFLSRLNIKAHVCITGESLFNPIRENKLPLMNIQNVATLYNQGWNFINHTMNHTALINTMDFVLENEIITPVTGFNKNNIKLDKDFFCLPEGKYDEESQRFLQKTGYKYILSTSEGIWDSSIYKTIVPRISISSQSLLYALYKILFKYDTFWNGN
jgi:peptidoglycan/xylan/chitin deacetylase (PgdA/CDA1 family)